MGNNLLGRRTSLRLLRTALIAICLFAGISAWAAPMTVSGTVTQASDGEPLIGVSIQIKGTNHGTTTDIDGNYSLNAEKRCCSRVLLRGLHSA